MTKTEKGLLVGIPLLLVGVVAFNKLYDYLYSKLDWTLGTPEIKPEDGFFVIHQPVTFISKLPLTATVERYEGASFYEGLNIATTEMGTFSISKNQPATTTLKIRLSPNLADIIGSTIKNPLELLKIIQNGITERGNIYLKLSDNTSVRVPFSTQIIL